MALFIRRSFARSMGYSRDALEKPVVGIVDTRSDLNSCHRHIPELVEAIKRGVWQAGGLPLAFPTISLGEVYLNPSSMMFRNLMALDVEAMIKAQPVDAVVLLGGCDKTVPALLMGAASAGVPAIVEVVGPMLSGNVGGERVGACTDCRRFWARFRGGEIDRATIDAAENALVPTGGTCGVMGTASTMACLAEAMGLMLPGGAAIPAVHADRLRHGEETGKRAVALAGSDLAPAALVGEKTLENALRVLLAIGGSTNAIIHLAAVAGRAGIRLQLSELDRLSETTPVLVDLKPTGDGYMDDFFRAGGLGVVLRELAPLLHLDAPTVTGATLGEVLAGPYEFPAWQNVIRPRSQPLQKGGGLVVLRGNLAPDGAVLKRSAATPALQETAGRAVVFTSLADLAERIDDPFLDVNADDVLVLQNAGPRGGPGMPEAGALPIPRKLAAAGVKDMVRISDARMSGSAFGTIVLHVSPEAAVGGPLSLVRSGDRIALSVQRRELNLLVDDAELAQRRAVMAPRGESVPVRGYERLYHEHVQQAHLGCDFDFLRHETLQATDGSTHPPRRA
jgi:dihydroxy-acid dehydratase